ncbi:Fic family protein (plasmid) [Comamonadaceae bacterium OTU4NAUVB1]|nr:Fic family protein [Comamonadaceae bacterium OTU4NAUVB1]
MRSVGYAFVREALALAVFAPARPASVRPVTRLERGPDALAVPAHVAPSGDEPLSHLLFAIKHEGIDLQILAKALPRIPPEAMQAELRSAPNGQYIRVACHLWEAFAGRSLGERPDITARYVDVFDPSRYVTGPSRRDARWRVNFNGLGSLRYCVNVERTPALEAAMASDVLGRTRAFVEGLAPDMMDRALSWAYLHETEDSYAIEREAPTEDKARAFIALLKQAHEGRPLDEDYLVELQSSIVANPFDKAVQFRTEQNWLRGAARGAAGVSHVPPPPGDVPALMDDWMAFANTAPRTMDPVLAASIASFGFVFIHPFMDGNGRLSRFLFHKALCDSGQLARGLLLPVSVAMKRHEGDYLATLQAFSRPARELVQVTAVDADDFRFDFRSDDVVYRYWDATRCVEFGFRMAELALDVELRRETTYLMHFDAVHRAIDERFDVRGSVLATLVAIGLQADGTISRTKRARYAAVVPAAVFDAIEMEIRRVLASPELTPDAGTG